jgi:hypothetical protein
VVFIFTGCRQVHILKQRKWYYSGNYYVPIDLII